MLQELLTEKFNIAEFQTNKDNLISFEVKKHQLSTVLNFLKNTAELDFDMLYTIVGIDFKEYIELDYTLFNTKLNKKIIVKVKLEENEPKISTISDIFPSANYDEREIYDLFGVEFTNHPNMERLLLPESWIGNPLKKDYDETKDERLQWNR